MFCLQVVLQYERKNSKFSLQIAEFELRLSGMATFGQLYSNLFFYPLYIGLCLLLMLIYSVVYLLLAIYVERINPGGFGVAQPWNYLFKKTYWKPQATATVQPSDRIENLSNKVDAARGHNHWIEANPVTSLENPSLTISHLTKVIILLFLSCLQMSCISVEIRKVLCSF